MSSTLALPTESDSRMDHESRDENEDGEDEDEDGQLDNSEEINFANIL